MIEMQRDEHAYIRPILTCDVCFEPISNVSHADAICNTKMLRTVVYVHHGACRRLAYRLWGRACDLCVASIRVHLVQLIRSIGYLGLALACAA
jgi:hypothetical protein